MWGKLEVSISCFGYTHTHTVQKRMLFRTVMSKKWRHFVCHKLYHHWTDEAYSMLHSYVFPSWSAGIIVTLRTYIFVVVSGTPLHCPRLSTLIVHPLMWCSSLFFLIICHLSYTTVLDWSRSGMSPSEFGSCINGYIWLCKCRPIWIPPTHLHTWKHTHSLHLFA